jgi:hypothetical protein
MSPERQARFMVWGRYAVAVLFTLTVLLQIAVIGSGL